MSKSLYDEKKMIISRILDKTRKELKYAFIELLWIDAIPILLLMSRFSLLCSIHVWKILIMTGLNACLLMIFHTIVDLGKKS